jgi:hypothetical protein
MSFINAMIVLPVMYRPAQDGIVAITVHIALIINPA